MINFSQKTLIAALILTTSGAQATISNIVEGLAVSAGVAGISSLINNATSGFRKSFSNGAFRQEIRQRILFVFQERED